MKNLYIFALIRYIYHEFVAFIRCFTILESLLSVRHLYLSHANNNYYNNQSIMLSVEEHHESQNENK